MCTDTSKPPATLYGFGFPHDLFVGRILDFTLPPKERTQARRAEWTDPSKVRASSNSRDISYTRLAVHECLVVSSHRKMHIILMLRVAPKISCAYINERRRVLARYNNSGLERL